MMKGIKEVVKYIMMAGGYALMIAIVMILGSCSDPELEPVSRVTTLKADGGFSPETPSLIHFPVKAILAIDDSGSMTQTDANDMRIQAVKKFYDTYLPPEHENVFMNVYLWADGVKNGTDGFTQDKDEIQSVLDSKESAGSTHYMNTLSGMYEKIHSDILKGYKDTGRKSRSKYVGIFLSDGTPTDNAGLSAYIEKIEAIKEMVEGDGSSTFVLHTYLLANGLTGAARVEAERLLSEMAIAGEGEYTVLESADDIDFTTSVDMSVTIQYRLKYFFACNYNARPGTDKIFVDSDADGLSDEDEEIYGSDPQVKDTDNDGYTDYFEITRRTEDQMYDPLIPGDIPCTLVKNGRYFDTDRDGLTDCEENYLGTSLNDIDTDKDFIPDEVEFIFGTNPLEPEAFSDSDQDGIDNKRELQLHTNPASDDPKIHKRHKYAYVLDTINKDDALTRTYNFDVSNIKIVNTLGSYMSKSKDYNILSPGENLIRFYYCQLPEDSTNLDELVYRMAEVKVEYGDKVYENFSDFDFMLIQGYQ